MLKEIQSLEDQLIYSSNCGSSSKLFTAMMHKTSEWIDSKNDKEVLDYSPIEKYAIPKSRQYRYRSVTPEKLTIIVDSIAKFIELGSNLNVACTLTGYTYNFLRRKFTNEHKAKFKIARELKFKINN